MSWKGISVMQIRGDSCLDQGRPLVEVVKVVGFWMYIEGSADRVYYGIGCRVRKKEKSIMTPQILA